MQPVSTNARSGQSLNFLKSRPRLKISLFLAAIVPLSLTATKGQQLTQSPVNSDKLTVVTVKGDTTVFQKDGFTHGFGYDIAQRYAKNLGLKLDLQTVKDDATALQWVKKGKAQFAMTTTSLNNIEKAHLVAIEGSCGAQNTLEKYGLNNNLNWVFKSAEDPFAMTAAGYLCKTKQDGTLQKFASFYDRNYVKPQDLQIITRDLNNRLPTYKTSFQRSAKTHDLDWHFLAAIAYQESYLKPDSVSPTGVRGVMMLTSSTAKAMGVQDRTNPAQSIQGGAKYFDLMLDEFEYIPYPDRNWYALVAYNMGPGAINKIRGQIKRQGKNPDQWINLYNHLENNQRANGRYRQAVQYVKRIRVYLEHIKTTPLAQI